MHAHDELEHTDAAADCRGTLNAAAARRFIEAGRAVFTLRSALTGARYTYRVDGKKNDRGATLLVSVLTGSSNTDDYTYLGRFAGETVADDFWHDRKRRIGLDAPSAKAFQFAVKVMRAGREFPAGLEFWHEGRCGRCGRLLTDPESIARGLGPTCAGKA